MTKATRILSALLVLVTLFSLLPLSSSAASTSAFDVLSSSRYAKVYTLATSGRTVPYTSSSLTTRGTVTYGASTSSYIDNRTDELYLIDVGITGGKAWAYVSYPTSSRRVYAYIPLSALTANNGSHAKTVSTGKFYCSLRSTGAASSSYFVAASDTVYLVATSGSKCQILYSISGNLWRLAWCSASDYQKYCAGGQTGNQTGNQTGGNDGMVDVTAYFAGKQIFLQSVENGKYLCVDANASKTPALCNRTGTTTWTVFTVSAMTADGWVGFRAKTNGKYLSVAGKETGSPLRASAAKLSSWECFRIYLKDGNFYIKAQANHKWLSVATFRNEAPAQATAPTAAIYERFRILFRGEQQYVSAAELIGAAVSNGIRADSNAYAALRSINTKYAPELSAADKKGTMVFLFEGVGSDASPSKRMNAMCVLVKNGKIAYLNRNCSTIPDYPFNPAKNGGDPMPTTRSGIYRFTTVNHKGNYAALNVPNVPVVRFRSKNSFYHSTSVHINVHRRSTNAIAPTYEGWVNSAGCLLIGQSGTSSGGEYARFIQAVGIVPSGASGNATYRYSVTGKIVIDRTYAYDYLSAVGYSDAAIADIG